MKPNVSKTLAASAVTLLIAACGGGSGDAADPGPAKTADPTPPSLQVSGTAATGLALAGSAVEVKCAAGTGSATTDAGGAFTLTIADGALPCIIKVTGEADGRTVTLHSVTEVGTGEGTTTAIANVTPLTEMIVAQLTGSLPGDLFESFDAGSSARVTQAQLISATAAVVNALKAATGIDLGDIDPFKSPLVAATSGAPDQGNAYDQLLDQLKTKVPNEALPLIVNQIAAAASTAGSGETPSPVTLGDIMANVEGGSLPGCPVALSGKYRTIDYWGRTSVRHFDFKNRKVNRGDNGAPLFDIAVDAEKPCEFIATGTVDGVEARFDFVIGSSGAGSYRSQNLTSGGSTIGYIFPVQAHKLAAVTGAWNYLQSGFIPGDPVGHFPGQMVIGEDHKVSFCDYRPESNFACELESDANERADEVADGGFDLNDGASLARLYGYRAPSGALTVFGTTNPAGATGEEVEQTSIIATRPRALGLPEAGSVAKYWNLQLNRTNSVNSTTPVDSNASKTLAVDASAGTYTRERVSDGQQDSVQVNRPVDGFRFRPPGNWGEQQFTGLYQFPVPSLGITASINAAPSSNLLHFYSISVTRP